MFAVSGINIITYYAATIFENNIGLSGFLSRLLAALNGTEYFIASFIAIFTIERFGRRQLMLFGAVGQALSMAGKHNPLLPKDSSRLSVTNIPASGNPERYWFSVS
jgi:predicted MFS family arabinose efflux permease